MEKNLNFIAQLSVIDQGRLPEAVAACRRAVSLKANYAEAYYNLGLALDRQQKHAAAEDQLT